MRRGLLPRGRTLRLQSLQHLLKILFHDRVVAVLNLLLMATEFTTERLQANVELQIGSTSLTGKHARFARIDQPARLVAVGGLHWRLRL